MNETTYLFSSLQENPDFFFQGYCFIDNDYIFGFEGASEFKKTSGKEITLGEDGCYILMKKEGDKYIFGSDSSGYKKILYYRDEVSGVWAVSNSLYLLIKHLKNNSITVTPNIANLKALTKTPTPTQQSITFTTIANEIKILPLNTYLLIGKDTLEVKKVDKNSSKFLSYEDLLLNFVEVWSSRLASLLNDDRLIIEQAITGGVDSRSVFSLTELARQNIDSKVLADHYLICGLTRGDRRDLDVAEKIASYFNYPINVKRNNYEGRIKLDNWQRYSEWRAICLGTYAPIYFPSLLISPFHTALGGGGGENHRPFYADYLGSSEYTSLIKSICKNFKNTYLEYIIRNELSNTFSKLSLIEGKDRDLLIAHYKNFRTRFHIGLFPQYRVTFTPLSSNLLDNLSLPENQEKFESSQLLYDLINLTEGLIDFPFDSLKKEPSEENINDLINLDVKFKIDPGICYIGEESFSEIDNNKPSKSESPLDYLKKDFDLACETRIVNEIFDQDFIISSRDILKQALNDGKLPYAAEGRGISTIIAASLFELDTI